MNILIIRVSAIGDVFLASQFAEYVKKTIPHSTLHWLVEKRCSSPLKYNPYIDKILYWERDKKTTLNGLFKSAEKLDLSTEYDLVIDLQCLLKLFPVLVKIKSKNKVGISEYEFPMNLCYNKIVQTQRFEPLKEKYHRIAQDVIGYVGPSLDPYPAYSKEDKASADLFFKANNIKDAIACIFATSMEHKYWDRDKWVELSKVIKEKYNKYCILFGAKDDLEYAKYLTQRSDNFINLVGKTTLTESMAYLTDCSACVSTDTAMMHFASILNIPTISLYGTNFFYSHHFGRKNVEIIYKGDMNNKDKKVPNEECKKNMQNITVDDVINALEKQLSN